VSIEIRDAKMFDIERAKKVLAIIYRVVVGSSARIVPTKYKYYGDTNMYELYFNVAVQLSKEEEKEAFCNEIYFVAGLSTSRVPGLKNI